MSTYVSFRSFSSSQPPEPHIALFCLTIHPSIHLKSQPLIKPQPPNAPTLLQMSLRPPSPPPIYSPHDPSLDSDSDSLAPSYTSDTPTYTSYRAPTALLPPPLPGQHTVGLPPPGRYAPGFAPEERNRMSGRTEEFSWRWGG